MATHTAAQRGPPEEPATPPAPTAAPPPPAPGGTAAPQRTPLAAHVTRCIELHDANAALLGRITAAQRGGKWTVSYAMRWVPATAGAGAHFELVEKGVVTPVSQLLAAWKPGEGARGAGGGDGAASGGGGAASGGSPPAVPPAAALASDVMGRLRAAAAALVAGTPPAAPPAAPPLGIRAVHDVLGTDRLSYDVTTFADLVRLNEGMVAPLLARTYFGDTLMAAGDAAAFATNYEALHTALAALAAQVESGPRPTAEAAAAVGRVNESVAALVTDAAALAAAPAADGEAPAGDRGRGGGTGDGGSSGGGAARHNVAEEGDELAQMAALKAANAATLASIRAKVTRRSYSYAARMDAATQAVVLEEAMVETPTAPAVAAWVPPALAVVDDRFGDKLPLPAPRDLAAAEDLNNRMVVVARKYEDFRGTPVTTRAWTAYLANYHTLGAGLRDLDASLRDGARVGGRLDAQVGTLTAAIAGARAECAAGRFAAPAAGAGGGASAPVVQVVEVPAGTDGAAAEALVAALPASTSELRLGVATRGMRFGHLPRLRIVGCRDTGIGDDAVASLPATVEELDVRGCRGLSAAAGLQVRAGLRTLWCEGASLQADVLAALAGRGCGGDVVAVVDARARRRKYA
ncbi:MAG: hypothetical protein M9929_05785 [Burkholderiaceae bacterium]|nr:hypothetical protein [Burkholderiaceae bacterium]